MWHLLEIEGVHHLSVSVVLGLSPLDRSPGILEPVNDVVDVQRLLSLPRVKIVEYSDIFFHLESGGMIVLCKPGLKFWYLMLRVKTNSHSWLVFKAAPLRTCISIILIRFEWSKNIALSLRHLFFDFLN